MKTADQKAAKLTMRVHANPMDCEALIARATYYYDIDKYEEALLDADRILAIEENDPAALCLKAACLWKTGNSEEALQIVKSCIRLYPEYSEAYRVYGLLLSDLEDKRAALTKYEKALQLDPENARAYNSRGYAFDELYKYDRAIGDYTKAIELKPDFAGAYNNRGNTYAAMRQYDRAIDDYAKAIELNSDYADTYSNRGAAHAEMRQYDLAINDYNQAIDLDPSHAAAYNNRGDTFGNMQQYGRAIDDLKKAIDLYDKSSAPGARADKLRTLQNLKRVYLKCELLEEALATQNHIIALSAPDNARVYVERGDICQSMENPESALLDYHTAIEILEKASSPLNGILLGNVVEKIRAAQTAILSENDAEQVKEDAEMTPDGPHTSAVERLISDPLMRSIEEKMTIARKSFLEFMRPKEMGAPVPVPVFHILRRWNSYTPIITSYDDSGRGGGYFLQYGGEGIVIDPGLQFVNNFQSTGFWFNQITKIYITHAHNDHTADLESILTLLHVYNKRIRGSLDDYDTNEDTVCAEIIADPSNQDKDIDTLEVLVDRAFAKSPRRKTIELYLSLSTYKKYAIFISLKNHDVKVTIVDDTYQETLGDELTIRAIRAKHDDILSNRNSLGFLFTYKDHALVYTGDTGFDEEIGRQYRSFYEDLSKKSLHIMALAHVGGFKQYEITKGKNYKNHLGRRGLVALIEKLEPEVCLISEFGEEFKSDDLEDGRQRLCTALGKVLENTIFLPMDIGFSFNFLGKARVIRKIDSQNSPLGQQPVLCYDYVDMTNVKVLNVKRPYALWYYYHQDGDESSVSPVMLAQCPKTQGWPKMID